MLLFSISFNFDIALVSLNYGSQIRKSKNLLVYALLVSAIQSLFPLIGNILGNIINAQLGSISRYIGSIFLILIGFNILWKDIQHPGNGLNQADLSLILIATGLEDFMMGVTIGVTGAKILTFTGIFLVVSFAMNLFASYIGFTIRKHLFISLEKLTGITLIILGIVNIIG